MTVRRRVFFWRFAGFLLSGALPLLCAAQVPSASEAQSLVVQEAAPAVFSMQEYFYNLWLLNTTGAVHPAFETKAVVPAFDCAVWDSVVYSRVHWTFLHGAGRLYDVILPEYIGYADFYAAFDDTADTGAGVASVPSGGGAFVIVRPVELEAVLDEVAETQDASAQTDDSASEPEIPALSIPAERAESVSERQIRDAQGNLVLYSYGDEFFSVQNKDSARIVVRGDKKNLVRFYYDEKMRVLKKELWNYAGDFNASAVRSVQDFEYDEDAFIPRKSTLTEDKMRRVFSYDQAGRITESRNYRILRRGDLLESLTRWTFTEDGKISERWYEEFERIARQSLEVRSVHSKREVYEYKVGDRTPDYSYYEDGVLRMQTVYSAADDFITYMYFDNDFVVESYTSGGFKTKDVFYMNGKVRRVKTYEN